MRESKSKKKYERFRYYTGNVRGLGSKIGTFLSHEVKWTTDEDNVVTFVSCEEVNAWDRTELATQFVMSFGRSCRRMIGGGENLDLFIKEVAEKIDEFIPMRYFVKYHQFLEEDSPYHDELGKDGSMLRLKFKGYDYHNETRGLISHYKHDGLWNPPVKTGERLATSSQLSYIKGLAYQEGLETKKLNSLSLKEAGELIDYLLKNGKVSQKPDCFKRCLEKQ